MTPEQFFDIAFRWMVVVTVVGLFAGVMFRLLYHAWSSFKN